MRQVRCGDAEIFYEVLGSGPPVVVLHPFPANHEFWLPAVCALTSRYQVVLPDLRGHGDSELGEGPATMAKHAADLARVLEQERIRRAVLAGVSIGGYVLLEFWRRGSGQVAGLVLANTKAQADSAEGKVARLAAAAQVLERGTDSYFESLLPKLLGQSTRGTRPDLVQGVRSMMQKMSPEEVAMVQRGIAERRDSVEVLRTIHVPTLVLAGDEDLLTGVGDAQLMQQHIAGSQMKVVARAGHYSPWEQADEVGKILRQFVDGVSHVN
ncbi:MAG TPA: alpha/beta fold hydrolase [Terriglobales bacterium]|nr:alpha/beta fold hydrolase [Terriglobales bacterium]